MGSWAMLVSDNEPNHFIRLLVEWHGGRHYSCHLMHLSQTSQLLATANAVSRETFVVEKVSSLRKATKINHTKYFLPEITTHVQQLRANDL